MKKLLYTIGMLCIFTAFAVAQSWMPLANGIQTAQARYHSTGFQSLYYNGNLYVAYKEYDGSGPAGSNLVVQVWDGQSWSQLPLTDFGNSGGVVGLAGFQGDIYIAGGIYQLHRYDGTSWSHPFSGAGISGNPDDIDIHNGNLVVLGNMDVNGNSALIVEYDGSNWSSYPGTISGGYSPHPRDLKTSDGELYVIVSPDSLSPLPVNILKWDGTAWIEAAPNIYNPSLQHVDLNHLGSLNNRLYATGNQGLYEIRNDSLILQNTFSSGSFYGSSDAVFNGELYFGSPVFKTDGTTITPLANFPAVIGHIGYLTVGSGLLYLTGDYTDSSGNGYNYAMATAGNFSSLTGKLYLDANSNCSFDNGETVIKDAMLTINPGNINITTNQWGDYSVGVNAGTYSIDNVTFTNTLHSGVGLANCNALPVSATVASGAGINTDLAAEHTGIQTDAAVVVSGFTGPRARFGFTENYQLKVQNRGATALSGLSATLEVPAGLSISSATPTYDAQSGSTYTWNISSLGSLEEFSSTLAVEIDTTVVSMGDSLFFIANTGTVTGDGDVSNNTNNLGQEVVGAIDPNDKHANKVSILPGTSRLEYLINFQNTGNDTAYNVVIKDELESRLELEDLQVIASSHTYDVTVEGRTLIWTFNNILLPDSGANYVGSQGFVRFTLGLDAGLQAGDTIHNDADIFFDFQQPVHTNEARTAVVTPTSIIENASNPVLLDIYPNPAVEQIHIRSNSTTVMQLSLLDMSGKTLAKFQVNPDEEITYSFNGLSTGVYFLKSDTEAYRIIIQ